MEDPHEKTGAIICKLADDENAATIILGQRGLSKITRTLLGSTSDFVVQHAHCPVIIVPSNMK